jgi:hypothetical protein
MPIGATMHLEGRRVPCPFIHEDDEPFGAPAGGPPEEKLGCEDRPGLAHIDGQDLPRAYLPGGPDTGLAATDLQLGLIQRQGLPRPFPNSRPECPKPQVPAPNGLTTYPRLRNASLTFLSDRPAWYRATARAFSRAGLRLRKTLLSSKASH